MKRKVLSVIVMLLSGVAALFLVGELGLRLAGFSAPIWYQPDPQLGWTLRPGARGWFTKEGRAFAEVNAAGFRDRHHALAKPAGAYRIAVLGDSVVEAFQVDLKSSFWWQLEEKLRGCPALERREVEVLAFGVSGYGTAQHYLLLESSALRYQPDLVLLAFAPNDVQNNSARLEPENERPHVHAEADELKLDASFRGTRQFLHRSSGLYETYRAASDWLRLVQLVQAARHGLDTVRQAGTARANATGIEPTTIISLFAPPRDANWEAAWTVTERLVARMNASAARHHARFAVVTISHSAQVHPDPATRQHLHGALGADDLFYIERRLQALGQRERFEVIALAPELQQRARAENRYFHGFSNYRMGWGHWNEHGHRAAAELIAARLCGR